MIEKTVPVLYDDDSRCMGCTACFNICPHGAIEMRPNNEGFLYPSIDQDSCVGCRLCVKVCPLKK